MGRGGELVIGDAERDCERDRGRGDDRRRARAGEGSDGERRHGEKGDQNDPFPHERVHQRDHRGEGKACRGDAAVGLPPEREAHQVNLRGGTSAAWTSVTSAIWKGACP
jgi:hypothetical protein